MRFQKIFSTISLLFLLWLNMTAPAKASHIRAGDITAIRVGTLVYRFQVTLYTTTVGTSADSQWIELNFGDGSPLARLDRCGGKRPIVGSTDTEVGYYGFDGLNVGACPTLTHTFPGPGVYTISFVELNRIQGVANMSNSLNTPFSISITIVINPLLGTNTSPILTVPPIDIACVGQKFFHNPGAFDVDGDSLAFKMTIPKQSATQNVLNYTSPETTGGTRENGAVPPIFGIDAKTGDLIWDAPAKQTSVVEGVYNIAFIVEEWRNGALIGQVVRDMQIIVRDCLNKRPTLQVPDLCAVANDENPPSTNEIIQQITASDGDTPPDRLIISSEARQQVYSGFGANGATFTFNPSPQNSPASGTFRWVVKAQHVQRQPYIVVFKVVDQGRTPVLADLQSMLITVKGTPVRNVTATPNGKQINVAWNDYKLLCPTFTNVQFDKMQYVIWRREGCGSAIPCTQNPAQAGYTSIATLGLNTTNYTDNSNIRMGLTYSYVITVKYPETRGGESQASVAACVALPIETPIITKASVKTTNTTTDNGEVEVTWLRPKPTETLANFNIQFAPPYRYELYRAEGISSNTFTLIKTENDATGNTLEFNFTDTGLNTKDKTYLYRVEWFTSAGAPLEARRQRSDSSSTVRLTATPALNSVVLTWNYNTAWSNQNFIHEIYRGEDGQPKSAYIKIGEKLVGERKFTDDGTFQNVCLDPLKTYGYYVKTKGSYSNPTAIPEPVDLLRNDSQLAFASPIDKTPPPPPLLAIDTTKCPNLPDCLTPIVPPVPQNKLTWKPVESGNPCQDFIATYKLYFRPAGSTDFVALTPPTFPQPYTSTTYTHTALPEIRAGVLSQAGCYYITAIDQQGNESAPSNTVCQDNCLYFKLPNVFTPASGGFNDTFKACPTPQFVETVTFSVYNRWGGLVYRAETEPDVNWNGKNNSGKDVEAGVYYYEAKVRFVTIDDAKRIQSFKGWVTVIR
jgi:gliding motility-associated-like protein